jgi:abequosyltransferase
LGLTQKGAVFQLLSMAIKLSFCIPTFNFGAFIGATLRSIIDQADERVQIVVIDGGSTDDTAAIVAEAKTRFPQVKFIQRDKRHGLDARMMEMVLQADGEYCWLFSSDDLLAPGAVARAMKAIDDGGWDIFLMGITLCDLAMQPQRDHPILDCGEPRTFNWSVSDERADYFRRALTSTAFFSFLGNLLVRRDRWIASPTIERFIGSGWMHTAKVLTISQSGLRVRFDPAIYVLRRGDNDSCVVQEGLLRRIELSFRGFRDLGCFFFGEGSPEAAHVCRVVGNEYPFLDVLELKRRIVPGSDQKTQRAFYDLVRRHYARGSISDHVCHALVRLTPVWVLSALRPPYLFLRNLSKPRRKA